MIELIFVGAILLAALVLGFKIMFFILGLIFGSIGFLFRLIIFGGLAVFCFPVLTTLAAGFLSSWVVAVVLGIALFAILYDRPKDRHRERREYRRYRREEDYSDEYRSYRYDNRESYR